MITAKRLKRWLVAASLRALRTILFLLPTSFGLWIGERLGTLLFLLPSRPREVATHQIACALALEDRPARRIARRMFGHLGRMIAELLLLPRLRPDLDRLIAFDEEDRAVLDAALAEGRGVVWVSAHLGNWELLAQAIAQRGYDTATVTRSVQNRFLAPLLLDLRSSGAIESIVRGEAAAKDMLRTLRRGALLGFLIDQDTSVPSVFVPFFGRPAKTPNAAARLALRRKRLPVLFGFITRQGRGHRIRIRRIALEDLPVADPRSIAEATARMTRAIETAVREHPSEWVWFHERWKSEAP